MSNIPLKIYEDINQLFIDILNKKDSGQIESLFNFLKKNPQHSPFNNVLVFAQQPDCVYYMTAEQWKNLHQYKIKVSARPMIILFPFGPVKFVYDLKDTEKIFAEEPDKNINLNWWKENKSNTITENIFTKTSTYLFKNYHILLVYQKEEDFLNLHSLSTAGYAKNIKIGKKEIVLHPRYNNISNLNVVEAYGVLTHEIAHIFLGHLGVDFYSAKRNGIARDIKLCEDRSYISTQIKELEAELTAWLVFNRFGINKNSVDYMAAWITKEDNWNKINFSLTLRIANTIFEMKK